VAELKEEENKSSPLMTIG